jgi:hypothetical protein
MGMQEQGGKTRHVGSQKQAGQKSKGRQASRHMKRGTQKLAGKCMHLGGIRKQERKRRHTGKSRKEDI